MMNEEQKKHIAQGYALEVVSAVPGIEYKIDITGCDLDRAIYSIEFYRGEGRAMRIGRLQGSIGYKHNKPYARTVYFGDGSHCVEISCWDVELPIFYKLMAAARDHCITVDTIIDFITGGETDGEE